MAFYTNFPIPQDKSTVHTTSSPHLCIMCDSIESVDPSRFYPDTLAVDSRGLVFVNKGCTHWDCIGSGIITANSE